MSCASWLTGLGERMHLASPNIGLTTHIDDVVNTILRRVHDVVLVGHSYGGMVITGVADRIPDRIHRLVYIDTFSSPESGETALGLVDSGGSLLRTARRGGFSIPSWVSDTTAIPRDVPMPVRTFTGHPPPRESRWARRAGDLHSHGRAHRHAGSISALCGSGRASGLAGLPAGSQPYAGAVRAAGYQLVALLAAVP